MPSQPVELTDHEGQAIYRQSNEIFNTVGTSTWPIIPQSVTVSDTRHVDRIVWNAKNL